MREFVTLMNLTYPADVIAPKGKLESEGIEVLVKDELTVQVHNFYSNAIGGIRLQVPAEDFERAKTILLENGLLEEIENKDEFWNDMALKLKKIPFLSQMDPRIGLIVLLGICFSVVAFLFIYLMSR